MQLTAGESVKNSNLTTERDLLDLLRAAPAVKGVRKYLGIG